MKMLQSPGKGLENIMLDDEDYDQVSKYTWDIEWDHGKPKFYSYTETGEKIYMHRFIAKAELKSFVRIKNGNSFDLRRKNLVKSKSLRVALPPGVVERRPGYIGVVFLYGSRIYTRLCRTPEEAHNAYNALKFKIQQTKMDELDKQRKLLRASMEKVVRESNMDKIRTMRSTVQRLTKQNVLENMSPDIDELTAEIARLEEEMGVKENDSAEKTA